MNREDRDKRYAGTELVWSGEANRFLIQEVEALAPGRALDLGAGEGRNAVWLAERGWDVTAVDFSGNAIAKAHRLADRSHVSVRWVVADVTRFDPVPASCDLVIVMYLHLPAAQRQRVLAQASAALAPGGTLLYVGHDISNIDHGHGGPQDPGVLCAPGDVAGALDGLSVVRAEVVERAVDAEPAHGGAGGAIALDTLVRAVRPEAA